MADSNSSSSSQNKPNGTNWADASSVDGVGESGTPRSEGEVSSSHIPKIRHQETVDPRVVPNIIGRGHEGLKDMAAIVLEQTGTSVFIKYIRPHHLAWGFFGVNSHSMDSINMACRLIHEAEQKYIRAIESGELRPRIPEIREFGGGRPHYNGDRRHNGDRHHSGDRRHSGPRHEGGHRRHSGPRGEGHRHRVVTMSDGHGRGHGWCDQDQGHFSD